MYISIFRLEDSNSFLQCSHLPFPTQHAFFLCKTLVVICLCCGNPFFTKVPSFQGSFIALKKNNIYTDCSPSIDNASGTRPFFGGKEKNAEKNKPNKKSKIKKRKEKKGQELKRKENKQKQKEEQRKNKKAIPKVKGKNKEKTKQAKKQRK